MDISVVILSCNQRELTLRCLESLEGLTKMPDYEIVLVDNGSDDGTAEAVGHKFPEVRIIRLDTNRGVAGGRNVGLRQATGKHLMILDNDTIADPDTILALSRYLTEHSDTGLVAPRLVSPSGGTQSSFRPYPGILSKARNVLLGTRRSSIIRHIPAGPTEPFYVIGAAQMFTREVYEASGGLDENIFYGPEDADFCMAVRDAGKKVVYLPQLSIVHDWQRATTSRVFTKSGRTHLHALRYFWRKHRRFL